MLYIYHGTDLVSANAIVNNGIDFKKSTKSTDNGIGFYTTPSFEFAKNRAIMMSKQRSLTGETAFPAVIKINLNDDFQNSNYSIKTFDRTNNEWKYFVVANRLGTKKTKKLSEIFSQHDNNFDFKYDIVIDETADSEIGMIVNRIKFASLSNEDINLLINSVDVGQAPIWASQISFHTKKSIECLSQFEIINI